MTDQNLRWMLHAKQQGDAPPSVAGPDPAVEIEMWRSYRQQLVAELEAVHRILEAAGDQLKPRPADASA